MSYISNRWYGASRAAGTINLPPGVNYAYCRMLVFSEGAAHLDVIDAVTKRHYVKMWNDVVGWGDYSELLQKDDLVANTITSGTILSNACAMSGSCGWMFIDSRYYPSDIPAQCELAIEIIRQSGTRRIMVVAHKYGGTASSHKSYYRSIYNDSWNMDSWAEK